LKNQGNKTIAILALISILLCACPGCAFLVPGLGFFLESFGNVQDVGSYFTYFSYGFRQGGWLICLGGFLIMVPFILAIIALVKGSKRTLLEPLEPTGASRDDPIPPAS